MIKIDLGNTAKWVPETLSTSGVKTYHQCPLKFYYQYVLRLPTPPADHFLRGNLVHAVFEKFFQAFPIIKTTNLRSLKKSFREICISLLINEWRQIGIDYPDIFDHDPYQEKQEFEMQKSWVEHFADHEAMKYKEFLRKNNNNYMKLRLYYLPKYVEVALYAYDLGLNGRIDVVYNVPYTQDYYPIDYKTSTKSSNYIDEDEELQLYIYALLLKQCEGKTCTEGHIYLARTGGEPIITLNDEKMKEVKALCIEAATKYKNKKKSDFPQKKNVFCKWCPYSQIECRNIVRVPKVFVFDYSKKIKR